VEVIGGEGGRGHLRTLQVNPRHHLRKRQSPLHQGEHPPAMDGGNHPRGGEPSILQLLQGLQKGLEILLSFARGPIAPVGVGGGHHSLRKRWEPPLVVPKVKPPTLPPLVRRGKDGRDVLLHTCLPQLKDVATGPHHHANSPLPRRQGKRLRGEEMGPQIPVGVNPQKPFANRREDGCLRDGVGAEIMQLHPVEMQNRPHKTTHWHSESPLVERDETQHIPRRRGWGGSARRGHPLRLRLTREGTKQAIGNKGLQIIHRDGRERPRVARRDDGHPIGHHQAKEVAVERTRCTAFFLWLFPLGCGNLSGRRAARVKNRHRSLFRIYIKGQARPVQHFARTRREIQNSKAKRPFLERLAHAQRLPREPLVPSH
jgi:hypothetical protein